MQSVIQPEFFDPLIKHIQCLQPASNYIEFTLPANLLVDDEQVLKYFEQDAVLCYERGALPILKGTIKDHIIFSYIIAKWAENRNTAY